MCEERCMDMNPGLQQVGMRCLQQLEYEAVEEDQAVVAATNMHIYTQY
jgi:hypothetical protein